jgi:hypothetical protein
MALYVSCNDTENLMTPIILVLVFMGIELDKIWLFFIGPGPLKRAYVCPFKASFTSG